MSTVLPRSPPTPCVRARSATPPRLSCRECGHQVELGPALRVSGVLRPAGDRLRLPTDHPRGDRGRPGEHLALQGAAAGPDRHRAEPQHGARLHPPAARRTTSAATLGIANLWVKDDSTNPTNSFKDRVVACALSAATRVRLEGLRLPLHRQPGQRGRRRRRPGRHQDGRLHPEQPRAAQAGQLGRLHRLAGRRERQLRRRQQARLRDRGRGGRLGVRQRQRPPLLRRGLQDPGLRDRRAARLAAARPDRHPGRERLAADQGAQGLPGAGRSSGSSRTSPTRCTARRPTGCSPVSVAYKAGVDAIRPVKPDTIAKSLAIGNPADGIYVLDICRETGGAVEDITDDEVREAIVLLARTEGIFTETAGGTTVGVLKKLVETGQLDPTLETVVINTGHGLKTLDAVAGSVGPRRDHRAVVRRVRRHRHRLTPRPLQRSYPPMTVSVRIPTILRTYTGGESEVSAAGATLAEVLDDLDAQLQRHQGPDPRRGRRAAALRERLRRQRRRPLPRQPGHPHPRRHPDLGDPGRGRRLLTVRRRRMQRAVVATGHPVLPGSWTPQRRVTSWRGARSSPGWRAGLRQIDSPGRRIS